MNKRKFIVGFGVALMTLCCGTTRLSAQDTLQYYHSLNMRNGITGNTKQNVRPPVFIDSIDVKGNRFSDDSYFNLPSYDAIRQQIDVSLSNTNPQINPLRASINVFKAENGVLKIKVDTTNKDFNVAHYYFQITNTAFAKGKIGVYSTAKVKIGMDGKEIGKRMSKKDSLNEDSKTSCDITLEPGGHIFSVSVLLDGSKQEEQLQVIVSVPDIKLSSQQMLKRGFTLLDMLNGERPYRVSMSDNGNFYLVKYSIGTYGEKNKYRVEVYRTSDNRLEWSSNDLLSVNWLPSSCNYEAQVMSLNGKMGMTREGNDVLWYVKKEGESSNLYFIYAGKGTMTPIVVAKNLPEGRIAAFLNAETLLLSISDKEDEHKEDLRRYLHPDDRIGGWQPRSNLALYDIKTGILQPLTFGHHNVWLNDVSDDGKRLLIGVQYDKITERPFSSNTFFEFDLDKWALDTLFSDAFVSEIHYMLADSNGIMSDEAKNTLIAKGSAEAFASIGSEVKKGIPNIYHNLVFLYNRTTKKASPLIKGFKPSVESVKILLNGGMMLTTTDKDSISVYFANTDTCYKLPLQADIVWGFDCDLAGRHYIYYGQNYNTSDRVFAYDVSKKENIEVAYPKRKMNEELALGQMTDWSFRHSGDRIDGRYYLPSDFDSTKSYPMIVYYYSGTTPTDRMFEMRYSAYLYTSQGYVFLVINPSGTIGYGQEFAARHVNAWGEKTADEIIFGVKQFCKEHSFVNAKRIGCMGASYGGFMTQYLQTKTDIFACAVSHAGISDITSYWGEGYWGYSYSAAASANSYPWNNRKLFVDHSPLFNADKIKTPLLLLHGTSDTNVPIGESIQMYNALKILGKEVEFISIKGENHGIQEHKKRMQWNNTIYAWFAKWLQDNPLWWDTLYPTKPIE
ncbi:MAG: prolyl oligopeptidase family serine peptidase [Bacteroidales bacterium]|jgi:dipeptidyl aminopeptidase/acylaminoacyl peptidase|nr:prolyl oligopeptidase family serine peptidase [Bacteroidales bacterium]